MGTNRLTGLMSGMDTESLINSLVEARKAKVTKVKKTQMSVQNKMDAWTDLNKKLKSFQSSISNLRYEGAYMKKAVSISDGNVASVLADDDAMLSTQTLKVKSIASTGYLTGAQLSTDSGKASAGTLLSDLGVTEGSKISIKAGKNAPATEIEITEGMTLSQFASKLSDAGVNAKFDASSQRLFISSKNAGEAADFSLDDADGGETLKKLGLLAAPKGATSEEIKAGGFAVKNAGTDGVIELNGAEFTSTNNIYKVNGLTITAKQETGDKTVSMTTSRDTSAMYDMVKKVIKEYSELVNEMDKLFNADTKTKYEPLTDEEKSEMSDYEIEKWEEKMKAQTLAGDSTVRSITSSLSDLFDSSYTINGKKLTLFDFGIETAGYFDAADNEKHALHIFGDEDEEKYKNETNKLKNMIAADPDTVAKFFSKLANDIYDKMNDMSSRVPNQRTFGSFYDDVTMKTDHKNYDKKISDMEEKITEYEDKWYKKFAAMEKAMAKMQSNSNAVSSMIGGGM